MARTPFKLKSQGSSFKMMGSSPAKTDETDAEGNPIPHEKTDEELTILTAERQKREVLDKLIRKAENQGLSGDAAKKAALAEYKRNIQGKTLIRK